MASWKGLEPPACRLGGDRSIQLSYQDVYEIVCHRRWKGIRLGGDRSILLSYVGVCRGILTQRAEKGKGFHTTWKI